MNLKLTGCWTGSVVSALANTCFPALFHSLHKCAYMEKSTREKWAWAPWLWIISHQRPASSFHAFKIIVSLQYSLGLGADKNEEWITYMIIDQNSVYSLHRSKRWITLSKVTLKEASDFLRWCECWGCGSWAQLSLLVGNWAALRSPWLTPLFCGGHQLRSFLVHVVRGCSFIGY